MNPQKLRAWWAHRQGLDGRLIGRTCADVLAETGWMRSVGGSNPYIGLHVRGGMSRPTIDAQVVNGEICELPSIRGCTYVVPKQHYALALKLSLGDGESADIKTANKFLGVSPAEIDILCLKVVEALATGPLDPKQLKEALGGIVRNLGEEGKKRGITTTLPLALGKLQTHGNIRRIPVNGRLDQQRYAYAVWSPSPLTRDDMSPECAIEDLARLYFKWIGPASLSHFQWISGSSLSKTKSIVEKLSLVPVESDSDLLMYPSDRDAFEAFEPPTEPEYRLVSSIDGITHLRRDVVGLIEPEDADQTMQGEKDVRIIGAVQDLASHAILDRGRLIGLWEYDPRDVSIAWRTFQPAGDGLKEEVSRMGQFIQGDLGDVRSFSLDSPESRIPRIESLRS